MTRQHIDSYVSLEEQLEERNLKLMNEVTSQDLLDRDYLEGSIDDLSDQLCTKSPWGLVPAKADNMARRMLLALTPEELCDGGYITSQQWLECAVEVNNY